MLYSLPYACQLNEMALKCEAKKVEANVQLPEKAISFLKFKDDFAVLAASGNIYVMPRTFEELKSKDISKWQKGTSADVYRNFVAFKVLKVFRWISKAVWRARMECLKKEVSCLALKPLSSKKL